MLDVTARAWDRHAPTYSKLFAPLTGFIARSMVTLAAPRLPPGARVLDIACGTGAVTLPAIERARAERLAGGPGGMVVGCDLSPGMVELTRAAAARLDADGLFHCETQNGEALGYADGSFDAAFSCFGIFLFGDRRAGWREAARVLRPGGTFVTSVWQNAERNPMLRAQIEPLLEALPEHLIPKEKGWLEISEPDSLVAEVSATAPLSDARAFTFRASFAVADWSVLWKATLDNPIAGALLRRCNEAELAAVHARWNERFRERAGGDGKPLVLDSTCTLLIATRH
jgi:ubiquinone/menaquinone biosynthesis C-methylase UbiE